MKSYRQALWVAGVFVCWMGASSLQAATFEITSNTNWSAIPGGPPAAEDAIVVRNGATLTVDVNNGVCASIQLGGTSTGSGNGTLAFNSNSQVAVSGPITLGNEIRTGTLGMTNGGRLICRGIVYVGGTFTRGTGTIELTATNTLPANASFGTFTNLTINGASTTTSLGRNTTVNGTLEVAAGTLDLNNFTLGVNPVLSGSGTITNSSANLRTLTVTNAGPVSFPGVLSGAMRLTKAGAGLLTLSGANTHTGTTTINAGTLRLAGGAAIADTGAVTLANATGATLDLNGTNETIGSLAGGGATGGNVVLGAGRLTVGDASDTSYSGVISGAGGALTKMGSGTLTLGRASTYTGGTQIQNGTLLAMNGSGSATGTGGVTVAPGATLGGNGFITGAVTVQNGGTVAPGTSVGTLGVGPADFSAGGRLAVEVADGAPVANDRLNVNGVFTLGGSSRLLVDFSSISTLDPGSGDATVTIAGHSSRSGEFQTVGWQNNAKLYRFDVVYNAGTTQLRIWSGGKFGGTPTPVTWSSFAAYNQPWGVLVEWGCASELENAGYHVYRRARSVGSGQAGGGVLDGGGWTRLNAAMIPGRLTYAGPTQYRWFDWGGNGSYEYRVESVSLDGERESHPEVARPVGLALGLQANFASRLFEQVYTDYRVQRSQELVTKLGLTRLGGGYTAGQASVVVDVGLQTGKAMRTLPGPVTPAAFRAVKVETKGKGVVWVGKGSLPEDFEPQRLSVYYEGQIVKVLGASREGVALWAPGYEDAYTDVDAFFLVPSLVATGSTVQPKAAGLFLKNVEAEGLHTGVAEEDFHEVYYAWSWALMPYDYPPWFSGQFLTEGSSQAFTLSTKRLSAGEGKLTVRLWSRSSVEEANPDHGLGVTVNGVPVGYQSWDGGGKMLELTFTVPAGVLREGSNAIELTTPVLGTEQLGFVHGLKLEYPQALECDGPMAVWTKGCGSGVVEVRGLPVGKAWVVEEVGRQGKLTGYEAQRQADGTYAIRWRYAKGKETRYFVVPWGQELGAIRIGERTVAPVSSRASYMAVGPEGYREAVQPLLEKRSGEGLDAFYAEQEGLFDAYGYGRFGPEGIQRGVRTVRPKYLLLQGRSTYDYRGWMTAVDPQLREGAPTVLVGTRLFGQTGSDVSYGMWGGVPRVAVGRLAVNSAEEAANAVGKILGYRGARESGGSGVIMAERNDPQAGDFHAQGEELAGALGEVSWTRAYQESVGEAAAVREKFMRSVNGGADVAVFIGHGSSRRWGRDNLMTEGQVGGWTGNAVVLIASCNGAYFLRHPDYPSSWNTTLAQKLLGQAGGGSPAVIGSPTFTGSASHVKLMAELLKRSRGSATKRWGDALVEAQAWALAQVDDRDLPDLGRTEQLLGDPALPVTGKEEAVPPPAAAPAEQF